MISTRTIKRIASLGLAAAFFLPLSQCSQVSGGAGPAAAPHEIAAYNMYVWPSVGAAIVLLLFFWPVLVQALALLRRLDGRGRRWQAVELVLCLCSAAGVLFLASWGSTLRIGAWLACGATAAYGLAAVRGLLAGRRRADERVGNASV